MIINAIEHKHIVSMFGTQGTVFNLNIAIPFEDYGIDPNVVIDFDNPDVETGYTDFVLATILEDVQGDYTAVFACNEHGEPLTVVTMTVIKGLDFESALEELDIFI